MSLVQVFIVSAGAASGGAGGVGDRRVGGPSASKYFYIVPLYMPNSLSIARRDIPLRLALSTAVHLAF